MTTVSAATSLFTIKGDICNFVYNADGALPRTLASTLARAAEERSIAYKTSRQAAVDAKNNVSADVIATRTAPEPAQIESTHVLFIAPHWKPIVRSHFTYSTTNSIALSFGADNTLNLPASGEFLGDMYVSLNIKPPTQIRNTGVPEEDRPYFAWTDYPGERIFNTLRFSIGSSDLDVYSSTYTNMYRQFHVPAHKKAAWDRCMGQQAAQPAFFDSSFADPLAGQLSVNYTNGPQTPTASKTENLQLNVPLLFWFCESPRLAIPIVAVSENQRTLTINVVSQPTLFNMVPRGAGTADVPNGSVDTNMTCTASLIYSSIFLDATVAAIYAARSDLVMYHTKLCFNNNSGMINAGSNINTNLTISSLRWCVEMLYYGARAASAAAPSAQSTKTAINTLRNWHKFHYSVPKHVSAPAESGLVTEKVHTGLFASVTDATLVIGGTTAIATYKALPDVVPLLAADNSASPGLLSLGSTAAIGQSFSIHGQSLVRGLPAISRSGLKVSIGDAIFTIFPTGLAIPALVPDATGADITVGGVNVAGATGTVVAGPLYLVQERPMRFAVEEKFVPIRSAGFSYNNLSLYSANSVNQDFYNSYVPYKYGDLVAPTDPGVGLIPFCYYPGEYQPSGHVNISRIKTVEFELSTNSYSDVPALADPNYTIMFAALCINFLHISNGTIVRRFTA